MISIKATVHISIYFFETTQIYSQATSGRCQGVLADHRHQEDRDDLEDPRGGTNNTSMSPHTHTDTEMYLDFYLLSPRQCAYTLTLSPGSPGLPGGPEAPGGPGRPYSKRDHILPTPYINNATQRAIFAPLTLLLLPPPPSTRKVVAYGREECMMQYGTARRAVNPFCVFFLFFF